eukprot:gene51-74_t
MLNFLTKLFGTKSEKDLKAVQPYVAKINAICQELQALSHDDLRSQTAELKQYIQEKTHKFLGNVHEQEAQLAGNVQLTPLEIEKIYEQILQAKEQYNQQLEKVLLDILPRAFAVVKETASRFKENEQLIVTATDTDRMLATTVDYVSIEGASAIWKNQWEVMGHLHTWDMVHYDEQLIGGVILHRGKVAEMATGEGKTLVATLPTFLNALVGKGVHIVTVNEYLAKRDAAWMKPIFQFHGLKVACIEETMPHSMDRKEAYQADITYGTNNEFGFDYLRDNMAAREEEVVQRDHHYAIVDEVDSVLIDDARTPLIISGPVAEQGTEQEYIKLNARVRYLYEEQKKLVSHFLREAKQLHEAASQEAGTQLFIAYRGLPKFKQLIKYLSEPGIKNLFNKAESHFLRDNCRLLPTADEHLLFTIDEKNNTVELTEKGIEFLTQQGEDPEFFILPDITGAVNSTTEEGAGMQAPLQQQVISQEYTTKAQRIHVVHQLLKAYALFEKDIDYIIVNGKAKIVDEQTGRVLEGRRYSDGLHQAIEAKEGIKIEKASQTYATITLQNYFRLYQKLAGMTGTAETEAGEFFDIYHLDVVVTPTHKPVIREDRNDKVYKTTREKFTAIIEEIIELANQGRPVLVGTTSVETSELLSKMLSFRKIAHQVLNAKQHQKEAEIVAEAGKAGTVTIATNMAGRGTDIKLTAEAKAAGGLAIVGTERHESRRVDRQLRGRSGRQGDVGSSQFFVSLEDSLMRLFISDRVAGLMDRLGLKEGEVIQHGMVTKSIERAQKKVEQNNYGFRKRLLEYDNELNKQREIIYGRRKNALLGHNLHAEMRNTLLEVAQAIFMHGKDMKLDYPALASAFVQLTGSSPSIPVEKYEKGAVNKVRDWLYNDLLAQYASRREVIKEKTEQLLKQHLLEKLERMGARYVSFSFSDGVQRLEVPVQVAALLTSGAESIVQALERVAIIYFLDRCWQEHLQYMDELKQAVQNAHYEQKDPLLIYKFESYHLFSRMIYQLGRAVISYLFRADLLLYTSVEEPRMSAHDKIAKAEASKQDIISALQEHAEHAALDALKQQRHFPAQSQKVMNRNERITVQYQDGTLREDVKYKSVEEDLASGKCVLMVMNHHELSNRLHAAEEWTFKAHLVGKGHVLKKNCR